MGLSFFDIRYPGLMTTASATTRTPKVKEIKSLNLHQPNIDKKVISRHAGKGNEEPNNGFWSDKLLLFASQKIVHISLNSPRKINDWVSLPSRFTAKRMQTNRKTIKRKQLFRYKSGVLLFP